jgi:nicotinate-nucleotide pyrophosphorylase (carboxylating)
MTNKTFYRNFDFKEAEKIIRLALKEDVGKGDITSNLLIPNDKKSVANLMMKEPGVVAGVEIFKLVQKIVDPKTVVSTVCPEGQIVNKCARIAQIKGYSRSLLKAERLSLNIIQRMSGIATAAYSIIEKLNNPSIKIVDTRKTAPNFRMFEKLAVKIGGGENHRQGLYDMILIKDNHIEANGGIENTLISLKKNYKSRELKVEIEVKDLKELQTVLKLGKGIVDVVMLDNFTIDNIKKAVKLNNKTFKIEVSGGVNYHNIDNFSKVKGVDIISVGALTHSVRSLDLSLDFIS